MIKLGLILMVLFVAFSIVTGKTAYNKSNDLLSDDTGKMPEIFKSQTQALEAYNVLISTFTASANGAVVYPDDYAGAWIDDNILHIALADNGQIPLADYASLLKDLIVLYMKPRIIH